LRIISCASYYGTGSSAITDLVTEFENVYSLTEFEFRFLQDPDGISDLEFNLVENHNRHNSGHALKRYKKVIDFNSGTRFARKYETFFDNKWKSISYKYLENLTDFSFPGWWSYDLLDKGVRYYYRKLFINKILKMTIWRKNERVLNVLPKEITYCSKPSEEKFLQCTREYINELFTVANKENKPNIMVDQIVPPSNLNRFIRYFDDIKVFVVDRDPRDLYVLEKYIWKCRIIPTNNVETFCKWFEYVRAHRKTDKWDDKVMFVQFEDLIYKYENTVKNIAEFLDFSPEEHAKKETIFKPEVSIKNTRLWENFPNVESDIEYIENELREYLYEIN